MNVGPTELIIVLVILLLIVGPKKLPGLGRSLGTGLREFKESVTGESKPSDELPPPQRAPGPDPVSPAAQDDRLRQRDDA